MKLLFLASLIGLSLAQSIGECFDGPAISMDPDNQYCSQYNEKSCCPDQLDYEKSGGTIDDGCIKFPNGCSDLINMLACGVLCKPSFFDEYVVAGDNELRLCTDYYDKVVDACLDLTYCPTDDDGNNQNCFEDDTLCERYFDSADEIFDTGFGFSLDVLKTDTDCFNSASTLAPLLLLCMFF